MSDEWGTFEGAPYDPRYSWWKSILGFLALAGVVLFIMVSCGG